MPEVGIWDWSKGWHPEKSEAQLEAGELAEAVNVIYRESLLPEKRRGFQAIRSSYGVGRVDGLVRYRPPGQSPYWVFAWGGAIYALTDDGIVTMLHSGLLSGQDYHFAVWKDRLFIVNGADGLLCWDGTTMTNLTTTPPPPPSQPAGFPVPGTVDKADATTITDYDHNWAADGVVPGDKVKITSGAGVGQERTISDIDGSTLHLSAAWATVPAVGDTFEVSTVVQPGASAPAGARFVVQHADRLWIGGSIAEPDRIFYSRLLDYQNWNDPETGIDNLIDVSTGDNQPITGMVRAREALMIFKERSLFYLQGYLPEEWQLDRVSDELGCIAPRSIAQLDSTVIWLSDKGVYMDDGTEFHRIGGPVDGWINSLTADQKKKAAAVLAGLHYILHFPDTPEGPVCLVWNGRFENWVKWVLPSHMAFSVLARGDGSVWAAASASNALVWLGDTGGADDGEPILARVRSASVGAMAPHEEYLLRRAATRLDVATGDTASVQIYSAGVPIGASEATVSGTAFTSVPAGQLARQMSVGIEFNGTGLGSRVHGVTLDLRLRRKRWA